MFYEKKKAKFTIKRFRGESFKVKPSYRAVGSILIWNSENRSNCCLTRCQATIESIVFKLIAVLFCFCLFCFFFRVLLFCKHTCDGHFFSLFHLVAPILCWSSTRKTDQKSDGEWVTHYVLTSGKTVVVFSFSIVFIAWLNE